MAKIATRGKKLSGVLAYEDMPEKGVCREVVTATVEAGMDVGAALVRSLTSPVGTPVNSGTGNGVLGTLTIADTAETGDYVVQITAAAANGGSFIVTSPKGVVIGQGTVGVAFSAAGLTFTVADGAADFVVGDKIVLTVTGTVKYKWIEAADVATLHSDVAVLIETEKNVKTLTAGDHSLVVLARGKAGIVGEALMFKDALSAAQKATVLAAFKAKEIRDHVQV